MNPESNDAPTGPTGPRTEEGKKRIRFNAVTHGLTGQTVVFNSEEAERYNQQNQRIAVHYQPIGPIEDALVRQIADDIWRLGRASSIEHGIFALSLYHQETENDLQISLAPARTWRDEAKELTLLTLYVRRIENRLAANKEIGRA